MRRSGLLAQKQAELLATGRFDAIGEQMTGADERQAVIRITEFLRVEAGPLENCNRIGSQRVYQCGEIDQRTHSKRAFLRRKR
jgi:hypothetical protein